METIGTTLGEAQPERQMSRSLLLLQRFREVDNYVEHPPRTAEQSELDAAEELHDDFLRIFAELPEHDIDLARETYERLTDSDDPRDRFWAASLFSYMLPMDKPMGLSMLKRLIGREETEQSVQDKAWDELTTNVAEGNLLTFREGVEYVGMYHSQLRERLLARITHARGQKIDEHTRHEKFPPYRLDGDVR